MFLLEAPGEICFLAFSPCYRLLHPWFMAASSISKARDVDLQISLGLWLLASLLHL